MIKAYKAGEGFKLLDDYEIVGTVDNTREAFKKIEDKIEEIDE